MAQLVSDHGSEFVIAQAVDQSAGHENTTARPAERGDGVGGENLYGDNSAFAGGEERASHPLGADLPCIVHDPALASDP